MSQQHWDPDRYIRNASFVAELGMPVVELLDPKPGERILDLGCGDGALTAKLVAIGCDVVGVDASADQIAAAKARGLNAQVVDVRALQFHQEFDAVFSNAALHWVKEPDAVIAGVARALKPRGRFVAEFGGGANVRAVVAALTDVLAWRAIDAADHNPWYFPTLDEYRARLEAHGFEVRRIQLFPRPTPLPGSMTDWLETFGESFSAALPQAERTTFLLEVQEQLRSTLCDAQGKWAVDYVRLRFAAVLRQQRDNVISAAVE